MKNPCNSPLKAFKTPEAVARRIQDWEKVEDSIYKKQIATTGFTISLGSESTLGIENTNRNTIPPLPALRLESEKILNLPSLPGNRKKGIFV